MTLKWMADRLKMGTWTHVANRLCHLKSKIGCQYSEPFCVYEAGALFKKGLMVSSIIFSLC